MVIDLSNFNLIIRVISLQLLSKQSPVLGNFHPSVLFLLIAIYRLPKAMLAPIKTIENPIKFSKRFNSGYM